MFDATKRTVSKMQNITDNVAELVVLTGRLQPSIRAFVVNYCDDEANILKGFKTENIKKVRNRMLYCQKDITMLTTSLMDIADVLDENIAQLNELIS